MYICIGIIFLEMNIKYLIIVFAGVYSYEYSRLRSECLDKESNVKRP